MPSLHRTKLNERYLGNAEGVNYAEIDAKDPETLTEEEKIALLGRPRLGDITKIQIGIRESKEFKVYVNSVHCILDMLLLIGCKSIILILNPSILYVIL